MGILSGGRKNLGLLHANIPNMIGQITSILAAEGNQYIANMTNKSL